mmetsp:Transcript_21165/g.46671  ORF Transcript_21165/g.46671 Transcript_21165/m.46671 type:complete len:293 (-) Transcript_21165:225-1103(-)|eukprot:CAMPEP_0170634780 /NCGR_PEP_ID=MMETSP0224-20130122/36823_1 /TAXON_ID=285029 /ORGANISM="Togula jolla, Strain CCCM 725" /LENGTH=292 /DNA_ID=CAMNT_0010964141 /DNA_START=48 /DNA_END=926 /DNA_ORIENTATION=-
MERSRLPRLSLASALQLQHRRRAGRAALLTLLGAACGVSSFVPGPELQGPDLPRTGGASQLPLQPLALAAASSCLPANAALPPAPSGINTLPESEQTAVFLACFAVLASGTWGLLAFFSWLRGALPEGWFDGWQKTWPLVGAVFMAAGVAHFTAAEAFESIYPPPGTWGFWFLPGSAEFHVAWTGVAEILGGTGLFVGALVIALSDALGKETPQLLRQLHALSALGLFVLTLIVSPANIYMYTHGAQMVGLTPGDAPIPVEFHYVRAAFQVFLLAVFWSYYQRMQKEVAASS